MKNNGGWGLRSELWICLALTIFFAIAVILINQVISRLNEDITTEGNKPIVSETVDDSNIIIDNKNNNVVDEKEEIIEENAEKLNYNVLEDKLVSAGVAYASKYYKDKPLVVTVVRLQTESMLKELNLENTKCSGYIEIDKEDSFTYYPYIKCGDIYETEGYDSSKDNLDL